MKYTIQSGDTLNQIASKYGTTAQNLGSTNNIADINKINAGQVINVPDAPNPTSIGQGIQVQPLPGTPNSSVVGNNNTTPVTGNVFDASQVQNNPSIFSSNYNNTIPNPKGYNFSDVKSQSLYEPTPIPGKTVAQTTPGITGSNTQVQAYLPPALQQPNPVIPAQTVSNTKTLATPPVNQTPVDTSTNNLSLVNNQNGNVGTPTNGQTGVTVTNYQTNPDGSTTEFMSDGSQQVISPSGQVISPANHTTIPPNQNQSSLDYYKSLMGIQGTQGAVSEQAYENAGIYDKMSQVNQIKNDMLANQRSYDEKIKAITDNNPNGTFGGVDEQTALLKRQQLEDQANYSIVLNAANGDLSTAQAIVDQKLQFQFAPIQAQLSSLSEFMNQNRQDLTASQQVQLDNQRFVLQNNLNQLMSAKQISHQFDLQNGITDPRTLTMIDNATTPAEAYQAAQGILGATGESTTSFNGNQSNQTGQLSNISGEYQPYIDKTSDGTPYVNQDRLNNLTPYQRQIASQQYADAGIRVLQPTEFQALNTIDQAKQDITQFETTANKLLTPGFLGRVAGLTTNQLSQFLQVNPEWRQFQTLRAGLIKSVQGIAAGAPGLRVTGAELENAADALPNSTDNLGSAQQAIDTFRKLLDINQNVLLKNQPSNNTGTPLAGINNYAFGSFFGS